MSSLLSRNLAKRVDIESRTIRNRLQEIAQDLPDVIALVRGDPDFHTPAHIQTAAKAAIDNNQHHYTHAAGILPLRTAIAHHLQAVYNVHYASDEIIVTSGAQEAIVLCMLALIEPGDEVLLPVPCYGSYDIAIRLCGGVPVYVPTAEADDFALRLEEAEARVTPRSKALVLVSPNNPTGAVIPPATVRALARWARGQKLAILSDEIYAPLIFPGHEHLSIASLPDMKERTILINGFSKAYAMTGWRVGYLAAPRDFVEAVSMARHTLSISANTPAQYAALAALTGPQEPVRQMRDAYAARIERGMAALAEMGIDCVPPAGGFCLFPNIAETGLRDIEFCEQLLLQERVMLSPGMLFADASGRYVRISMLQDQEQLDEAFARIARFVRPLIG